MSGQPGGAHPDDRVEIDGVDIGSVAELFDPALGMGAISHTQAENDAWLNEIIDLAEDLTGEDLSPARPGSTGP